MKKLLIVPTLFLFACGNGEEQTQGGSTTSSATTEQTSTKAVDLTAADWKAGVDAGNVTVLDVRTPGETAGGTIANAVEININDADFMERAGKLDKGKPVYVYCKAGGRSARAMKMLSEQGFSEVYNLDGGITAWIAAGYPIAQK